MTGDGVVMMVCTAGHVDHGKTSLVKLLTGCDTDRLKEEKERGLTIELGFAPCALAGGLRVGIVDVPGHEQFIRNMVSGIPGIDAAILLVAADDGIMPQTEEHLQILELLGVRHGIVALSKIDLVADDVVQRRAAEVREFLRGTCLREASVCPLSATTFAGFDDFYASLSRLLSGIQCVRREGVFRMPVERSFPMKGFGTVVSGIPLSGTVRAGDEVELAPSGLRGRVKAIQCFGAFAREGGAGQCLALNIPDFRKEGSLRGQMLSLPGFQKAVNNITLSLATVRELETPLRNAEQVKFHSGTLEATGKLYLLETKEAGARQVVSALVHVTEPVAVSPGDRCIIRRASPHATVGGGVVLHAVLADARLPRWAARETLEAGEAIGAPGEGAEARARVLAFLGESGAEGATAEQVSHALLLEREATRTLLEGFARDGTVHEHGAGHYVHPEALEKARGAVTAHVARCASAGKLVLGRAETARQCGLSARAFSAVLEDLVQSGAVEADGGHLLVSEAAFELPTAFRDLLARVRAVYRESGFQSPNRLQLAETLRAGPGLLEAVLDFLVRRGEVLDLGANVLLARGHFQEARDLVVRILRSEGALDSGLFKQRLGSTRKYALAVLDALDARGVTVRRDNVRTLAPGFLARGTA